jgi:hypothetical protein
MSTEPEIPKPPPLTLAFEQMLCARHGEPFRAQWPKGYSQIIIAAMETIQHDDSLAAECEGDLARLPAILAKRPICCRLPVEKMLEIYEHAQIGSVCACDICRESKLGTPIRLSERNFWGRVKIKTFRHVCFECWLFRLRKSK